MHSAGVVHRDLVGEDIFIRQHLLTFRRRNPVTSSLTRIVISRYFDPVIATDSTLNCSRSVISVSLASKILK